MFLVLRATSLLAGRTSPHDALGMICVIDAVVVIHFGHFPSLHQDPKGFGGLPSEKIIVVHVPATLYLDKRHPLLLYEKSSPWFCSSLAFFV